MNNSLMPVKDVESIDRNSFITIYSVAKRSQIKFGHAFAKALKRQYGLLLKEFQLLLHSTREGTTFDTYIKWVKERKHL